MCAKSLPNRFPLRKLNRKRDVKQRRTREGPALPRRAARKGRGISRRDARR